MFEIVAQGQLTDQRWRKSIEPDLWIDLGRDAPLLTVGWDGQISRRHVRVRLTDETLAVEQLESARNPVFFGGVVTSTFHVRPGEHFVIGKTAFTLTSEQVMMTVDVPNPISQRTFSPQFLRNVEYVDADRRIKVLNRLPDIVSSSGDQKELFTRMVNTLLEGVASATTVAIFKTGDLFKSEASESPSAVANDNDQAEMINVIHWDRRRLTTGNFSPSERLIRQAIDGQETVLHIWNQGKAGSAEFTVDVENDWAFVCPLNGQTVHGWGIYVTGKNRLAKVSLELKSNSSPTGSGELDLQGDVKFSELIASTLTNLLEVRQLERRQSSLRPFFSPVVMEAFARQSPDDVLTPRQCEVSVLFCDLRGFSKASEDMADDLLELLDRVSKSLGIMTHTILDNGGVIGDFHGDAAMGFWGWPLDQDDRSMRAVTAAMQIQNQFHAIAADPDHALSDFQMGVGIATGLAVAGKIGTSDQVKVTAFGPVVNLAARLESMTRWLDSSILIDGVAARDVLRLDQDQRWMLQRLGKFLPYGMKTPADVFRVFDRRKPVTDATTREQYDLALAEFESGDWQAARQRMAQHPDDASGRFLLDYIDRNQLDSRPPEGWRGVIRMSAK